MRALIIGLVAATSLRVCEGSDESGANQVAVSSPERAASGAAVGQKAQASARYGGSIVLLGDHAVELRVHRRGRVEAFVRTRAGDGVAAGDVKLSVRPYVIGGARPTVRLAWDPVRARFSGSAGAKVTLAPKPIQIHLEVDGKAHEATLSHYALITGPQYGGQVVVAGDHSAELLVSASGNVRAFISDAVGGRVQGEGAAKLGVEVALANEQPVALEYEAGSLSFVGKLGARGRLSPGPLSVNVEMDGEVDVGTVDAFVVMGEAKHGGQVVVAGEYSLELVAKPGVIVAYVFDASGKAHAAGDLQVDLGLGMAHRKDIRLVWDAPTASYRANVGAGLDVSAVPIVVSVKAGARLHTGRLASLNARAKLAGKANLSAHGAGAAQVKGPTLNASVRTKKTASAAAKVTPPKVTVKKSASATTTSKGAKARAGFSFGTK